MVQAIDRKVKSRGTQFEQIFPLAVSGVDLLRPSSAMLGITVERFDHPFTKLQTRPCRQ